MGAIQNYACAHIAQDCQNKQASLTNKAYIVKCRFCIISQTPLMVSFLSDFNVFIRLSASMTYEN